MLTSSTVGAYALSSYHSGADRLARMRVNYMNGGMRPCCEGISLTTRQTSFRIEHTLRARRGFKYRSFAQRDHPYVSDDNDDGQLMKWFRPFKTLVSFLAEQPSQLKYIEWPSIQSTLKTASLALVLVALFIVALSTVDSALCFILAFLSRRAA
ncbi:hypothetical protein DM860_012893 [Cuscuta australis]|uniref:Uncharacterized protein n=1 Tax=Cuscuta australis TaxID=267555 RepID=A0A328DW63_9ASTE|nr:hypothetical protein DM860_012893 [Cuscuta australis]